MTSTLKMLDFISRCPSPFHTVKTVVDALESEGYTRWQRGGIVPGGKYYRTVNDSSIIAFRIPNVAPTGFSITAAHSDSPTFKVKKETQRTAAGRYVQLCTEPYGGLLMNTWFDRPLGIAGRVLVEENGRVVSRLIYPEGAAVLIPSVAIHMDRTANDGKKINPAVDTLPLWGMEGGTSFSAQLAKWAKTAEENVLDYDLYLVCRDAGTVWGADNAFVTSPRLDDLGCVFGCLEGFLHAKENSAINVLCVFDNEETGSETKQGAGSTLLRDTLRTVAEELQCDYAALLERSYMVSADNGHARHPNHPELSDEQNCPYLNGGLVIKYNAAQRYTTDGVSAALLRTLCRKAGVRVQNYANRSDMAGGSTLGSIATTTVPVRTVDIGLAQLAMHSCVETMGSADTQALVDAMTALYSTALCADDDGALYWA
ncbi:MAG: M18 family aminopeptidase [Ruminococcaceae bacterium]|nr:M18 family aminopeptidase [Oscillospiraceae bacterium]